MIIRNSTIISLILSFCLLVTVSAQESVPLQKNKVGLVLSGGGARGIAHIGVIKALEENDIPIDYIAGTSMGAIIGGLYAAGYSPEEMLELIVSDEFTQWSKGESDRRYLYLYNSVSEQPSMFSMMLDVDGRHIATHIPTNLISTFPMDMGLINIFARASAAANNDFDKLFVPFRCVSSDINKGAKYVSSKGDLGTMIRASMSYPLYFKPVSLDSETILFDGGIVNNFPWDVVEKDFNPEYIIGSKCVSGDIFADENDIFGQIERMIMQDTNYDLPKEKGIVIETKMEGVSILDFNKAKSLMDFGYEQTLNVIDSIKSIVPNRRRYVEVKDLRNQFKAKLPEFIVDQVKVTQGDLYDSQKKFIEKNMVISKRDKQFDYEQLKNFYYKITGTDLLTSFYPTPSYDTVKNMFNVDIRAQKGPEIKVSVGGNIASGNINQGYLGIEHKYWKSHLLRSSVDFHIGRLHSSLGLGFRFDLPAANPYFFQLLGIYSKNNFADPTYDFLYDEYIKERRKEEDKFVEFSTGISLRRKSMMQVGVLTGRFQSSYFLESQEMNEINKNLSQRELSILDHTQLFMSFHRNTLNFKEYATKGTEFQLSAKMMTGNELYNTKYGESELSLYRASVRGSYESYYNLSKWFTLGVYAEAAYSSQTTLHDYDATLAILPAFEPTPYSKTLFLPKLRSHTWVAAGVIPIFLISDKLSIRAGAYLFNPYKTLSADNNQEIVYGEKWGSRYVLGMAAATWQSPVGPISLSVNYFEKASKQLSYMFNIGYILFNKRSM